MIAYNECGFCCMAQIFSFYIAMRAGEKIGYIISGLGVIHRQPVTLLQLAAFLSPPDHSVWGHTIEGYPRCLLREAIMTDAVVAVVMGSRSDWETMSAACEMLDTFGVSYTVDVVSAHRTPEKLFSFANGAKDNGLKVIIAGAGGAAHLPGMIAASTALPV